MQDLKVGDRVQWVSHGSGYSKLNDGTVFAVIPSYHKIEEFLVPPFKLKEDCRGMMRKHTSYLVRRTGAKVRLNWPPASQVKRLVMEAVAA